jgi:hypothetical protein
MRDKLRLGWDVEVSAYLYVFVFVVALRIKRYLTIWCLDGWLWMGWGWGRCLTAQVAYANTSEKLVLGGNMDPGPPFEVHMDEQMWGRMLVAVEGGALCVRSSLCLTTQMHMSVTPGILRRNPSIDIEA